MNIGMEHFQDKVAASLRTDLLGLIVLPTEKCNFRCSYCYEDYSVGRMRPETIQAVKLLIKRRIDGLHALSINWFGGEPLLGFSVIEDISSYVVSTIGTRAGLHYNAGMTTNGYFLDMPMVERLLKLGVTNYQISLDGPQWIHDSTRVRADGGGSFEQVWNNLLSIKTSFAPVKILLRVHLTPENQHSMPEFLTQVRDTFLEDHRFSVFLKPVARLGGPNDKTMKVLSEEEKLRVLADLEAVLLSGQHPEVHSSVTDICYASRHNAFVIRANGAICKCTVRLNDPANTVGRLLPDGTIELDADRNTPWLRGWKSRDSEILSCPAKGIAHE